jgi:hypothetical protein
MASKLDRHEHLVFDNEDLAAVIQSSLSAPGSPSLDSKMKTWGGGHPLNCVEFAHLDWVPATNARRVLSERFDGMNPAGDSVGSGPSAGMREIDRPGRSAFAPTHHVPGRFVDILGGKILMFPRQDRYREVSGGLTKKQMSKSCIRNRDR